MQKVIVRNVKDRTIAGELAVNHVIATNQDHVLKITDAKGTLELEASVISDLGVVREVHAEDGTVHQNPVHHHVTETNINTEETDDAIGRHLDLADRTAVLIHIDTEDPKDIQKIEKCM